MKPQIDIESVSEDELQRVLAKTPVSWKTGIIEDNGVHYLTLFKTKKSKRPLIRVPVMLVMDTLNIYFDIHGFDDQQ